MSSSSTRTWAGLRLYLNLRRPSVAAVPCSPPTLERHVGVRDLLGRPRFVLPARVFPAFRSQLTQHFVHRVHIAGLRRKRQRHGYVPVLPPLAPLGLRRRA